MSVTSQFEIYHFEGCGAPLPPPPPHRHTPLSSQWLHVQVNPALAAYYPRCFGSKKFMGKKFMEPQDLNLLYYSVIGKIMKEVLL